MSEKPQRLRASARALCYAQTLSHLQQVAREHGYALAVHGSMQTDLDLIAVPWVEEAAEAVVLIEALRDAINGYIRGPEYGDRNPAWKPHGRLAWSIYTSEYAHTYLDVSVMPRRRTGEHYAHADETA